MKEITTRLYEFNELSESIRQKMYHSWYDVKADDIISDVDGDFITALVEFEKALNIKVDCNSIGYRPSVNIHLLGDADYANEDISGFVRVYKWVVNNWYDKFVTPKLYHLGAIWSEEMPSNVQMVHDLPLMASIGATLTIMRKHRKEHNDITRYFTARQLR